MDLEFKKIHEPELLALANHIDNVGTVCINKNKFVYLDVLDNYIHQLFPLIQEENAQKPDYFSKEKPVGAHITIAYPEEVTSTLHLSEYGKKLSFSVDAFCVVNTKMRDYFVLTVICPQLSDIRKNMGLSLMPIYQTYHIPYYHITIAIRKLFN